MYREDHLLQVLHIVDIQLHYFAVEADEVTKLSRLFRKQNLRVGQGDQGRGGRGQNEGGWLLQRNPLRCINDDMLMTGDSSACHHKQPFSPSTIIYYPTNAVLSASSHSSQKMFLIDVTTFIIAKLKLLFFALFTFFDLKN